jgi:hypothetical protein
VSDGSPTLTAIDAEAHDQIVHGRRFGEANSATHELLHAGPQIDVLALDGLQVLFADGMLLGGEMPLVGPPSIPCKTV